MAVGGDGAQAGADLGEERGAVGGVPPAVDGVGGVERVGDAGLHRGDLEDVGFHAARAFRVRVSRRDLKAAAWSGGTREGRMERPVVGFVGVGLMGHGMAKNAVEKGFPLRVVAHRKREAVDDLVGRGAVECASLEAMAREIDVVVLCVTGSPEVEAALGVDRAGGEAGADGDRFEHVGPGGDGAAGGGAGRAGGDADRRAAVADAERMPGTAS